MSSNLRAPSALRESPSIPQPLFEIEVSGGRDEIVIRVKGELDLAERPRLERALAESEAGEPRRIVLDLEGLTFIDASGLQFLDAASARSAECGSRVRMTRAQGDVATILRLTALDLTLPFI